MKRPIVVGTDLSEASDAALVRAEELSTRDSVPLIVVHVVSPLLWGVGDHAEHFAALRDEVEERVTTLTQRARGAFEVVVERGLAHAVLARHAIARDALLVVGAQAHHRFGHALLKDVTERIVEKAYGPVLIVKPGHDTGPVVVAVDRPFGLSEVLQLGIAEAEWRATDLVVLHCVDTGFIHTLAADLINGGAYARQPLGLEGPVVEAKRSLKAFLVRHRIYAQVWVIEGDAQALVPSVALRSGAQLIVIGSGHGRRSLDVTNVVLRHAPCSTLVVDAASRSAFDR
jgi:nucleotide-binding universal stress UspA family protein